MDQPQTIRKVEHLVCGGFQKEGDECYALTEKRGRRREESFDGPLDYVRFHRREDVVEDISYNGDGKFSAELDGGVCIQRERGVIMCGPKGSGSHMRRMGSR